MSTTAQDTVAVGIQAGVPTILWGPPGSGKTSVVGAIAAALGMPMETLIASIREPADFGGLPVVREEGVELAPPAWARRLAAAGHGVAFFDEISTAPPAVQAALLRVILDRVVGDLALPETVSMVAAANPPEQAAGGWDLSMPLANRFMHIEWGVSPDTWVDGMVRGWPAVRVRELPSAWAATVGAQRAVVASFVKVRPGHLLQIPKDAAKAGRAWASPRTWDMAARMLAACDVGSADGDVMLTALAGCVGTGSATEFLAWRRDLDLPDPETLLADPERFKLPKRGDQQFAVLAAVASAAARNLTPRRWSAAWQVMSRAAEQGAPDVAAAAVRSLVAAGFSRTDLPLPKKEMKPFVPLLKAAGMMA